MTSTLTSGTAPGAVPLLGHTLRLAKNPLEFLTSLPAHGDLVEIKLGPWRAYVVCHPELAHQLLLDARTFDRSGPVINKFRQVIGNGLASSRIGITASSAGCCSPPSTAIVSPPTRRSWLIRSPR